MANEVLKAKCISHEGKYYSDIEVGKEYEVVIEDGGIRLAKYVARNGFIYPAGCFEFVPAARAVENTIASAPDPRIAELEAALKAEREKVTGLTYTMEAMKLLMPQLFEADSSAMVKRVANRLRAGEA